jgi:peptidyl-dipeptidase Dcp
MRLRTLPVAVCVLGTLVLSTARVPAAPAALTNPLLVPSGLPFGAPAFDKIKDSDYAPAFDYAIAHERRQVDAIAANPASPTFANTIVALEKAGRLLGWVSSTFYNVNSANTDATLQQVAAVEAPRLAALDDAIYLNRRLFARVQTLYGKRGRLGLDPESKQLLAVDYQDFVRAGARLGAAGRAKVRSIDERLATLRTTFQRQLLAATAAGGLVVRDRSQLAGMSSAEIDAAAQTAAQHGHPGAWMIPLQNTTQQPALAELSDRATRAALFERSRMRTERGDANDTRRTIVEIALLRAEKAHLLGYPNYASYALTDQMVGTPAVVERFLRRLIPPVRKAAATEAAELQRTIDAQGAHFHLQPYDWNYYAQRLQREKYHFDDNEVRRYFELNDVLHNGLFYAAHRLYGITLEERHDIPVYQKDVRVFEVYDQNGTPLALMYFDFFKRDNKQGGAWMSTFVDESKLFGTKPIVYNVENITPSAPGQPVLLTPGRVVGMFHEFGHALNAFFADQEYASLAGANTARDFVEYPSQFNEHWAFYPSILRHYAFDYRTHAPIPQALVAKIEASQNFNVGYDYGELLAADDLDMAWHDLPAGASVPNVDAFEQHALVAAGVNFPDVPPRYRSTYFAHIWSSGYAAGYYAYTWTAMLADDSYHWFLNHGGLTRANGRRFREMILAKGHAEDYGPMFRAFYGSDPRVGPLLKDLGLP